uniref:F-box only protein 15-like n=1 Tax=Ciona intestinalis TaxID=7719 RepID=UPI000180B770|nr:F-box only protein 15-like [Ciona intestinalis]|eukprot:XP_002119291.1 F-box only protein 15-like [Ciona intestinalis]
MNRRVRDGLKALSSAPVQSKRRIPQDPRCYFNKLPDELIVKVFQYADIKTLIKLTYVCSKWRRLSEDDLLWQQRYLRYTSKVKAVKLKDSKLPYKVRLFKDCRKIRDDTAIRKTKLNPYTAVVANMDRFLWAFEVQFQICFTTKDKTERTFTNSYKKSFSSSTVVQWSNLEGFPKLSDVSTVSLYARIPLMLSSKGKPIKGSPRQLSLLCTDKVNELTPLCEDRHIKAVVLPSGMLVALWSGSEDIAFVCVSIHHHDLVKKILYSNADTIYTNPHIVVADDIDTSYGLHGYKCHINLHTLGVSLFEEKFSGMFCNEAQTPRVDNVKDHIELNVCSISAPVSKKLEIGWKTDLFQGSLSHTVMLGVTLVDINNEVMWEISRPVKSNDKPLDDGVFSMDGFIKEFKYSDKVGEISLMVNVDGERANVQKVKILLNVDNINIWFGTDY